MRANSQIEVMPIGEKPEMELVLQLKQQVENANRLIRLNVIPFRPADPVFQHMALKGAPDVDFPVAARIGKRLLHLFPRFL